MNKTKIEWTDMSWNPITGCLHTCKFCYARAISKRFGRSFEPMFHPSRLPQPTKKRGSLKIFVGSMSDMLGEWVDQDWIDQTLAVIRQCPQHTFQWLTKNPERASTIDWPVNCWVGASTCTPSQYDRAKSLADCNAVVKYISAEPLLGPVRLNGWTPDWVIIGAQTGAGGHQPQNKWIDDLTSDTVKRGAALFYKPNIHGYEPHPREFPLREKDSL